MAKTFSSLPSSQSRNRLRRVPRWASQKESVKGEATSGLLNEKFLDEGYIEFGSSCDSEGETRPDENHAKTKCTTCEASMRSQVELVMAVLNLDPIN